MSENGIRGRKINKGPWRYRVQEVRNAHAKERQEVRNSRTPAEQLQELDRRLGVGVGARKERERLQKQL